MTGKHQDKRPSDIDEHELLNPLAILLAILIYGLLSRLLVRFLKALLNSR